jgi:two-component system sensor histidine kinase AlgZ
MAENPERADEQRALEDFFLPDLCQAQSILFLVMVAELLVIVMVLAPSDLIDFSWAELGLASLFVQWVVLSSAAILCNIRPVLMRMTPVNATIIGYALILSLTLVFSVGAQWLVIEGSWSARETGAVGRNVIVAAVMTGIAFRYFFLQHQLRRQEQAELNSRIQALQSRIRPHFLFNSMNIIASLIEVDPESAEDVVEDLSLLFRASLNDSTSEPVPLAEELELCEKYVHIESLRLDERLEVEWDVSVDPKEVRIPLLTLQPLLENAIYHGIQPNPAGGIVTVSIHHRNKVLVAQVTNPIAETSAYSHERGNRMALDNIRRRLEAIYGRGASVSTEKTANTFRTRITYPWGA